MNLHRVPLGLFAIAALVLVGCGKRGDPLPPLLRIPAAPGDFSVARIDTEVYARFTVPTVNADGVGPADVARVELYAVTAEQLPEVEDAADLRKLSTLVGTQPVRRPLPPPPPPKEGMPPVPLPPPGPGVDQGAVIVMREALTEATRTPPAPSASVRERADLPVSVARPQVAPSATDGPQRFYFAVGVNARGRYGSPTHLAPVPLGSTSAAPPRPEISVTEKTLTIRWTPPADARSGEVPTPPGLLPSRPTAPAPPPTTYDVYEVPRDVPANQTAAMPVALTEAPVGALEFVHSNIRLGTERCFVVRPVDILSGLHVRGPASPMVCASFADTFAPAPPGTLDAVSAAGAISLIWEPSPAADVAGYLVLRGEGANATLSPLAADPLPGTTYIDNSVTAGTRYVYAVVAVDKAGNRSAESNRVEETARQ